MNEKNCLGDSEDDINHPITEVFASPQAADRALHDSDGPARADALFELIFRWNLREEYRQECVRMAFEDEDAHVRASATSGMISLFENTSDKVICNRLARIVTDEGQNRESRLIAYMALLQIAGLPVWDKVNAVHEFRFPQDVDSSLIYRFL